MMKQRRWNVWILTALLCAAFLCGCGASGRSAASANDTEASGVTAEYGGAADSPEIPDNVKKSTEKRIYSAEVNMETTGFDSALQSLEKLVASCGGYFSSSSVGDYGNGYRYGSFTVRVPAENFQPFLNQVGQLCHVTWKNSSCEDVSEYYYDTEGRLKTQQTKLERLQALLAQAERMEDIITIESAISDTEREIESLTGELKHYDDLVADSTVQLNLEEVYRLSNTEEPATGFGSRIAGAFSSGWKAFTGFCEELLVSLAYAWVWLLIVAGAAVGAVILFRRKRRRALSRAEKTVSQENGDKTDSM